MKDYPSIPRSTGQDFQEFTAHVWDKLDGSNLRAEWSKKSGWYKFGTRTRLVDHTDPVFGGAPELLRATLGEDLIPIFREERWEQVTVFFEFWGAGSLGGLHEPTAAKHLTLFDVCPYKKGILGPSEFLKKFVGKVETATYLGQHRWTRGFVEQVREGKFPGMTFEGVVGKAGDGHKQIRAKAKTQAWIDAILARYGEEQGEKLVNS